MHFERLNSCAQNWTLELSALKEMKEGNISHAKVDLQHYMCTFVYKNCAFGLCERNLYGVYS